MLILVRHGRTAANAEGRLQGHLDVPLDDVGEWQASRLAAALGPVDHVISSPLARARQTAETLGLPVEIDERWIELDYGDLDGRPISSLGGDLWARWRADTGFVPPGGESLLSLSERVVRACLELAERCARSDVVVATHVSPIKAAVAWTLGAGIDMGWRAHLDQASITRISLGPSGPVLQSFNETAHLRVDEATGAPPR